MRYVTIDVSQVVKLTDQAVLCWIDHEEVWLPLSQIENADGLEEGDDDISINVAEWLAKEKGLIPD